MTLDWLQQAAQAVDTTSAEQALIRQNNLTKPAGSLGQLETLAIRFAGLQGRELPQLEKVAVRVFAADHGVAAQGVSAFPQAVTAQMIANFCAGGAAICVLSKQLAADFKVVNLGCVAPVAEQPLLLDQTIAPSTADFTATDAMTQRQLEQALTAGREQVSAVDAFIGGEMGIGNTTSASALLAALYRIPVQQITGRGTGINDQALNRKLTVIEQALWLHKDKEGQPLALLAALGGFEIAALVGAYISCAQRGVPVIVDGFITTAAAAIAMAINPSIQPWLFFSHLSNESGHKVALQYLNATPLLSLDMRLGEGSGAAVAAGVIRQALALHAQMATFAQAGVSNVD